MAAEVDVAVLVGLQASGKSTFYARCLADRYALVSKDLFPRGARHKQQRQMRLLAEHLAAGRPVVVDNTNATPEARAPLIALGKRAGARVVGVNFQTSVKGALERNRAREGTDRVPDVAIFMTSRKLKAATIEEGFDEVRTVTIEPPSPQGTLF